MALEDLGVVNRERVTDADALGATTAWFGDKPVAVKRIEGGAVNDTWRVDAIRMFALRRHRRSYRASVELEHAASDFARDRGIPSPEVLPTIRGTHYLEQDNVFWTLYEWAAGVPLRQTILMEEGARRRPTVAEARLMGEWLGRLHIALSDFELNPSGRPYDEAIGWGDKIPDHETDGTLARIDVIVAAIDALPEPEAADWLARDALTSRSSWLDTHRDFRPAPPSEPRQLIHADYNSSNIFVENGRLTAVIDWDEVHVDWPSVEVVSTSATSLDLDPSLVSGFLEAYRGQRDLPWALLEKAVLHCSWDWAHGLWVQEMVYLENDHRLRPLVGRPPFIPLHEAWPALGDQ